MGSQARRYFPLLAGLLLLAAIAWATWRPSLPPADYTMSNGTEIKSVDPAIVTGNPEGVVIRALYEGLVAWDPKDLHPVPGVAERWEISADGLEYTFFLRRDAKWSNGKPVNAHDFLYSMRRFLDPMLGAEYVFLLSPVTNADKYNRAQMAAGDPVEVELPDPPPGGLPHARGELIRGKLLETSEHEGSQFGKPLTVTRYVVEIDGRKRTFSTRPDVVGGGEKCAQVLLDFEQVAIKALDDFTIQIRLDYPTPYFLQVMGFYPLYPVNRECIETHGYPDWTRTENIVTNGPFQIQFRRVRDRLRCIRNPHYWDQENIHLNVIDILAVESQTTELNMYLTGQIDYFRAVPATIIPTLLEQKRKDFNPEPYLGVYYFKVNTEAEGLTDLRVRRALSLVVDRHELVKTVTKAGQIPAYRFVPQAMGQFVPAFAEAKRRLDVTEGRGDYQARVKEAKSLMRAAGYPDGQGLPKLTLIYNTNDMHAQIAELIQAQWKEILGIDVELENKEWGTYLSDLRKQEFMVARHGWIGDYVDPMTFLNLYLTDGPQNNTGFGDPRYDRLLEEAKRATLTEEQKKQVEQQVRAAPDWSEQQHPERLKSALIQERRVQRMLKLLEAEQILLDAVPVIPLYYYVTQDMVRPWVKGFYHNIQDAHPFKGMRIDKQLKERILKEEGLR